MKQGIYTVKVKSITELPPVRQYRVELEDGSSFIAEPDPEHGMPKVGDEVEVHGPAQGGRLVFQ